MAENQLEEVSESQQYAANKERGVGVKYYYREAHTKGIIHLISLQGDLYECLSAGCRYPQQSYTEFVTLFYKIFTLTSQFTNDSELVERIEGEFSEGREKPRRLINSEKAFNKRSWDMIDIWKEYLVQLKEAGIFNPEVENYVEGKGNVFLDSIG